ncbi:MAG: TonB-dependent receptor [Bacteroidia bacterium]|nr:TonB-dependent receptor [Bacteroidia bacterium]
MKKLLFSLLMLLAAAAGVRAQYTVSGTITDGSSGELLPFAIVATEVQSVYAVADVNGLYKLSLPNGTHTLTVKLTGYTHEPVTVKINGKSIVLNLVCYSKSLKEVEIVADVAIDRKTPVAFSNVSEQRIREEGAGRDVTMLLNSTPGAYATEQGGGAGDSRVNMRGFDQRNIAVMVDGVPVNDMENGQVYWSNWDGLGDVTRTMQVQRGLGASRLALPSVGGTINILTRGIEQKQGFVIRQEVGNNGMQKLQFGFNSGEFGKGWGVTLAGSRRTGRGWTDLTWNDNWSYFLKVQKRVGTSLLTFGVNGAPQSHGQRTDRMPIGILNREMAEKLGVDVDSLYANGNGYTNTSLGELGLRYNPHWGTYVTKDGQTATLNERVNYYHKPQISFSHFWMPNEKFFLSNVVYLSIGAGGGTRLNTSVNRDFTNGQLGYQTTYNTNSTFIDALYSTTETKSTRYINASVNNHFWYGALSTATFKPSDKASFLFGIDARHYRGEHYRQVYDLLGGDYIVDAADRNQPNGVGNLQYSMKREGDKITFYNDGLVWWGGLFAQGEFKTEKWSTFFTLTGSQTGYQRVDYFRKRDVILEDGEVVNMIVGYNETYYANSNQGVVAQNGATINTSTTTYQIPDWIPFLDTIVTSTITSIDNPTGVDHVIEGAKAYNWANARTATTRRIWLPGFTAKTGFNYNINKHYNAFVNVGFMNMPPRFNNVFDNNNEEFTGIENQKVYAFEAGFGTRHKFLAANLNVYYTYWKNKPPQFTPTLNIAGDVFSYNINGMDAIHKGIELDVNWKITSQLTAEALMSLGDWRNNSAKKAYIYDQDETLVDSVEFDARGVHVGDAAQTQFGGSLRWEPIKRLYIKGRYTYFDRHWANLDPLTLIVEYDAQGDIVLDNRARESYQLPGYGLFDLFAGYEFRETQLVDNGRGIRMSVNMSVLNVLNTVYITDGQNGAGFDASSVLVYMGMGRRWTAGIRISF